MIANAIPEAITSWCRSELTWVTSCMLPTGSDRRVLPVLPCQIVKVTANRTAPEARKTAKNSAARRTLIVRRGRRARMLCQERFIGGSGEGISACLGSPITDRSARSHCDLSAIGADLRMPKPTLQRHNSLC